MKKVLVISIALIAILMTAGIASAHWRSTFSFGAFFPPVVVWAPVVPPVVYPTYPPYSYYSPGYYGYRLWVPGHWESRWTPYGWTRAWIRGYWR